MHTPPTNANIPCVVCPRESPGRCARSFRAAVPGSGSRKFKDLRSFTYSIAPMKSAFPSGTPLWRRMSYAVAAWKYMFGTANCSR